jgi:hypothetical protein
MLGLILGQWAQASGGKIMSSTSPVSSHGNGNAESDNSPAPPAFASYEDFFTFYLHEHSDPHNRAMHAAGTVLGLCTLIIPFVVGHPWYALLWPVVAYSFAWTGHFLIEGNKPATFGHPLWSFISDFKMLGLMVTGKLQARIQAGSGAESPRS